MIRSIKKQLDICLAAKGVSQTDVGRTLGISMGTTSRYFSGGGVPKAGELLSLSRYFGVSMHWLMTGEPQPPTDPTIEIPNTAPQYCAPAQPHDFLSVI